MRSVNLYPPKLHHRSYVIALLTAWLIFLDIVTSLSLEASISPDTELHLGDSVELICSLSPANKEEQHLQSLSWNSNSRPVSKGCYYTDKDKRYRIECVREAGLVREVKLIIDNLTESDSAVYWKCSYLNDMSRKLKLRIKGSKRRTDGSITHLSSGVILEYRLADDTIGSNWSRLRRDSFSNYFVFEPEHANKRYEFRAVGDGRTIFNAGIAMLVIGIVISVCSLVSYIHYRRYGQQIVTRLIHCLLRYRGDEVYVNRPSRPQEVAANIPSGGGGRAMSVAIDAYCDPDELLGAGRKSKGKSIMKKKKSNITQNHPPPSNSVPSPEYDSYVIAGRVPEDDYVAHDIAASHAEYINDDQVAKSIVKGVPNHNQATLASEALTKSLRSLNPVYSEVKKKKFRTTEDSDYDNI
ncbi:uncharacterized protein LOC141910955 isoform X2 [Tubulanus polymorphus]|uniref:uncharacterized protein LOC141910955 isoform X2 n=1 Tax=Tubulanus polymorphus TaxID=672921 RepID=UPI003DA61272